MFLFGLVVALSLLLAALEYRSSSSGDEEAPDEDLSEDIETLPAIDYHDMIAAAPAASSSAKLNVTEKPKTKMEKLKEITDLRTVGNGQTGSGNAADGHAEASQDETALSPVAVDKEDNPLNFRVVEQLPEFPGGMVALMKWLTATLRYPPAAQKQKIQGKVIVSFIINKDGTIADAKVVKSVNPILDGEALRVVKIMPKWKPGVENDKPCRTLFAIPVVFKI